MRLSLAVGVPLLVVSLTEATLRLSGYGYSTRFFERLDDGLTLTTNPQFAWQYYPRETATSPTPLLFPLKKTPGSFRIIVLGESAAAGTPDPAFGFARQLEVLLRSRYPTNRFEVLNAAMRGIDSHIIRRIARECVALSPDLFVLYLGNNELIGLHAPSPEQISAPLWLLRLGHTIKATRLAQLLQAVWRRVRPTKEGPAQNMEFMRRQRLAFDDPRRNAAYANFQANLEDICKVLRGCSAPILLSTVAVNLRDFPPLASLHQRDLTPAQLTDWEKALDEGVAAASHNDMRAALARFEAAARVDDHFAELHFRMARAYDATSQFDAARRHYGLARDWDALQFRADSRLNGILRHAATNGLQSTMHFVDLESVLADCPLSEHQVPGGRIFHEHVHFTFDGDYEVAKALLPSIESALGLNAAPTAPLPRDDCAKALAFTPVDALNVRAAMARQTAKAPFQDQLDHSQRQAELERQIQEQISRTTMQDFERAAAIYRDAIARNPEDWMRHYNFGNLLSQFGQHAAAAAEFAFVVQRLPRQRVFRLAYGNALLQAGRAAEAIAQFHAALKIDPQFKPARDGIAAAQRRLR
jgi:tetratricopeptide (TPR) repeat protein